MKLIVLARKNILPHISGFRCKNKNTGYAGLRNKVRRAPLAAVGVSWRPSPVVVYQRRC